LVAGNPNAKAKHFDTVKMELANVRGELAKTADKLRAQEKKEEATIKKVGETYQAVL